MKMTGMWARCRMRFKRRQASKPPIPGITASSRMRSGVTRSVRARALSPSTATSTVDPLPSIASVRKLRVSGESSTTRTMSRLCPGAGSILWRDAITQRLHGGHIALQLEIAHQRPQVGDDGAVRRIGIHDLVQLGLDAADIADVAELMQVIQVLGGNRRCGRLGGDRLRRGALLLIDPFEAERLLDGGK